MNKKDYDSLDDGENFLYWAKGYIPERLQEKYKHEMVKGESPTAYRGNDSGASLASRLLRKAYWIWNNYLRF